MRPMTTHDIQAILSPVISPGAFTRACAREARRWEKLSSAYWATGEIREAYDADAEAEALWCLYSDPTFFDTE